MKLRLFFYCFFISSFLFSGNENYPIGARSTGMGGTGLCLSDVWSVQYNQAGLANVKLITAGVSYESRFTQSDLGIQSFGLVIPVKNGGFGLNYVGFGSPLYKETKIGLGYGMNFSSRISGGINLNYHGLNIAGNYGNKSSFTFEVGLIAQVIDHMKIGFHLFNPLQTKLNEYESEIIPTIFKLGLRYDFSDKVFANLEYEKDIDLNPIIRAGIEYHPIKALYLRTGISSNPSLPSIGFGVDLKNLRFDFASTFHPVLGASPAFALIFSFDKK